MPKNKDAKKVKENVIEIERKLKEAEEKMKSYLGDLQRVQADFENYVKRSNKEKDNLLMLAKYEIISKLLPILDDFENALKKIRKTNNQNDIAAGVEMIFKRLNKFLDDEEVKPIESLNKKFDPYVHEIIKKIDSDKEEGTIIEEIQKGYSINDNLLRPAKVIISDGMKKEGDTTLEVKENEQK